MAQALGHTLALLVGCHNYCDIQTAGSLEIVDCHLEDSSFHSHTEAFQVESDYASTLLVPLPDGKTPLMFFNELFKENFFRDMDTWATFHCKIPRMKDTDIQVLEESFDMAQYADHVSDHATIKPRMISDLNLVSLSLMAACIALVKAVWAGLVKVLGASLCTPCACPLPRHTSAFLNLSTVITAVNVPVRLEPHLPFQLPSAVRIIFW